MASFCLFSLFSWYNFNNTNWKSVDGVLGIQTRGRKMVGTDETTELWRPPQKFGLFYPDFILYEIPVFSNWRRTLSTLIGNKTHMTGNIHFSIA